MSYLIADPAAVATLAAARDPGEVVAPDGRVLGRFIPAEEKMSYPELGVSDAELERRATDPNAVWVTPEQVMERLREIDRCGR
jgi:hypothetical protein